MHCQSNSFQSADAANCRKDAALVSADLPAEGKLREEMNEAAAVRPTPQYMECRQVPPKNEPRLNVQRAKALKVPNQICMMKMGIHHTTTRINQLEQLIRGHTTS